MAEHFFWICHSEEWCLTQNNFLYFLKHMHQLENKRPSNVIEMEATSVLAGSNLLNPSPQKPSFSLYKNKCVFTSTEKLKYVLP